jgi:hypothetical protein
MILGWAQTDFNLVHKVQTGSESKGFKISPPTRPLALHEFVVIVTCVGAALFYKEMYWDGRRQIREHALCLFPVPRVGATQRDHIFCAYENVLYKLQ